MRMKGSPYVGLLAALVQSGCSSRSACGEDNLSYGAAPPVITVVNAATGQPICDATVLAACAGFDAGMPLVTFPAGDGGADDCSYGVVQLAADGGLYAVAPLAYTCSLEVSKSGFASMTVPNVGPQGGGCTPATPQVVTVKLPPN
jgi:hypothetical protein